MENSPRIDNASATFLARDAQKEREKERRVLRREFPAREDRDEKKKVGGGGGYRPRPLGKKRSKDGRRYGDEY